MTSQEKIKELLTRGVEEAIVARDLEAALKSGRKLRVKLGIDPTAPDIHLGHTVSLRKLKQFQDLGHKVVLIIGDFTATIGDPSGRSELRKPLSEAEIKKNEKNYLSEIGKIINIKKTEVRHNSDWYKKLGPMFLYELTSKVTVAKVLDRDDFQKRLKNDQDISMLEILYPLLQGYDSVEVKADVELGGTDQKFNLLMGRKVQKRYGRKEQNIMTVPLIEGTDGVRKMSKSYGNYIGISEDSDLIYGKIMSIPDSLIIKYFRLLTGVPTKEVNKISSNLGKGLNPRDAKARLAAEIVTLYHGKAEAKKAAESFTRQFAKKETPDEIPEIKLAFKVTSLVEILVTVGLASSKTNARQLIEQGGVRVDGAVIGDREAVIEPTKGMIIQVGKRKFVKVK